MRRRLPMFDVVIAVLVVLVTVVAVPSELIAQETAAATLVPGRRSITFGVFSGGSGSFGVWKMRDERTNLGLLFDFDFSSLNRNIEGDDNDDTNTQIQLGVGPEVRRYRSVSGRVAPYGFLGGRLNAFYQRSESEPDFDESNWGAGLSARVGLGVDFFPVPNLSIGVQTGVRASFSYSPMDTPVGDASTLVFDLETFTSSMGAAIYF